MITKELFISVMNTITEHRRTLEKIGQTLKESRSTLMVWDRDEGYLGAFRALCTYGRHTETRSSDRRKLKRRGKSAESSIPR